MTKRMLIDATHREETRVAITDGNKLAEYDYESQSRKPLKGSIFLAKVTRVEPSLQAAFVNFGGNRHGFLPFSEIHPDYFRIPVSDREALMAEQEELLKEHDEEEAREDEELAQEDGDESGDDAVEEIDEEPSEPEEVGGEAASFDGDDKKSGKSKKSDADDKDSKDAKNDDTDDEGASDEKEAGADKDKDDSDDKGNKKGNRRGRGRGKGRGRGRANRSNVVELVGGEEIDEEQKFRFNLRRKYKIQEVIKRGQIMLVQANKEERGNKGAAVGTYLSLPGRYCVLMPNSPRAGGVSRKIANHKDRARMRDIVKSLDVPKGMSVIVRTAGVTRTKAEIKRDLDYLMRLWNNIRELTLESTAPALVYEEADLIKRSVRDLYTRDIEEILVAGEDGYKTARNFMKMMIPSHVKKVKLYEDTQLPLFNRYQIENQIDEIGQVEVRLKSGGYLVINPTEALVSIDVNSGKSTKGRHIEETALKTNLEAAEEVARQLKLRDLGGLVVIDFIDMEDRRNNGKVERKMKEALSHDRARVQVGRISSFGLMELSRQRLSPSLTEAQYEQCKNCKGSGLVRTSDAMSILVLRAIEEEGIRARAAQIIVQVSNDVALYLLNYKRRKLVEIEERYGFEVLLRVDNDIPASECRVEVSKPATNDDDQSEKDDSKTDKQESKSDSPSKEDDSSGGKSKGTRRRGRRGGRNRNKKSQDQSDQKPDQKNQKDDQDDQGKEGKKVSADQKDQDKASDQKEKSDKSDKSEKKAESSDAGDDKPKARRGRKKKTEDDSAKDEKPEGNSPKASEKSEEDKAEERPAKKNQKAAAAANDDTSKEEAVKKEPKKKPAKKSSASTKKKASSKKEEDTETAKDYEVVNKPPKEKKKGWWNRLVE